MADTVPVDQVGARQTGQRGALAGLTGQRGAAHIVAALEHTAETHDYNPILRAGGDLARGQQHRVPASRPGRIQGSDGDQSARPAVAVRVEALTTLLTSIICNIIITLVFYNYLYVVFYFFNRYYDIPIKNKIQRFLPFFRKKLLQCIKNSKYRAIMNR